MIDQEKAEKILQADFKNILKKIKSGTPLSKAERELVKEMAQKGADEPAPKEAASEGWVSSYGKLGAVFGCYHASFRRWRKTFKDAPTPRENGDHSVEAWREFFKRHPDIELAGGEEAKSAKPKAKGEEISAAERMLLKREAILDEELRGKKMANDEKAGLVVPISEVTDWVAELAEKVRAKLDSSLCNELPPNLEGRRAAEMAALISRDVIGPIHAMIKFIRKNQGSAGASPHQPEAEEEEE